VAGLVPAIHVSACAFKTWMRLIEIRPQLVGNSNLRSIPLVQPDCVYVIENRLRLVSSAPFSEHAGERYPGAQTKNIGTLLIGNA
jgi:hypothetical protein